MTDPNLEINPQDIFKNFYNYCQDCFTKITQARESYYRISNYTVHIKFANETIQKKLSSAQEHLIIPYDSELQTDLTVLVWEQASLGKPLPSEIRSWFFRLAKFPETYLAPRGEIKNGNGQQVLIAYNGGSGVISLYDINKKLALCLIRDVTKLPYYEIGSPLKVIWHWLVQHKGQLMLHAGAVGIENKGVLLVGKGGSGKSTTALSCVGSELKYLSDDYCVVTQEPNLTVHSLFSTVKLVGENDLKRFPYINNFLSNLANLKFEKAMAFVTQFSSESVLDQLPLRAIIIPQVTGLKTTTWEKASPAKALFSLAPSSILQLPYANENTFQRISKIASELPCFSLKVGTEIKQIPKSILEILEEL